MRLCSAVRVFLWALFLLAGCSGSGDQQASDADLLSDGRLGAELPTDLLDTSDGSSDTVDSVRLPPAELQLPPYPWWPNQGMTVDEDLLAEQAAAWCAESQGEGGPPAFFFGDMPLYSVGALSGADSAEAQVVLGHMYLSGWYGGLWFRDNADLGMGPPGEGEGHPQAPVTEEDFTAIADNAFALALLSESGTPEEVAARNLEGLLGPPGGDIFESMMDSLLTLYGYNHGYVSAILDHPPAGVSSSGLDMPCPEFLDCPASDSPLSVFDPFRLALEQLVAPPSPTWEMLAAEVEKSKGWVAVGQGLWSAGSITAEAWGVLVEINRVYLRVTAAAALGSLLGHGDNDEDAGRCALLLEAATDTWNRAYFLALGADAPEGILPGVVCP